MSNRNYNKSANPATNSSGSSSAIRSEFTAIDAGFAGVEAELDLKLAATAQAADSAKLATVTPSANFLTLAVQTFSQMITSLSTSLSSWFTTTWLDTDTTMTADSDVKVSSQKAVRAFVAATAFAPVLPSQAGNASKFITTDGTNASWAPLPFLALLSVISVSSITYNANGSLDVLTYSSGNKITYGYTSGDLTTVLYYDTNGSTLLHTETISYTNGNVTAVTWS